MLVSFIESNYFIIENIIVQARTLLQKFIAVVELVHVASPVSNINFFDLHYLQIAKIFPSDHGLESVGDKKKSAQKVGVDVTFMHIKFGGRGFSGFGYKIAFKIGQISLSTHGL